MAIIPSKNPKALISYYLGILSLLPFVGFFIAIPAVTLGIMGIIAEKRNPEIEGAGHAWVGVVMGVIFGFMWFVFLVFVLIEMFASRRHF